MLPCAARGLYGSRRFLLHKGLVALRDIDAASGSSDALALNVVDAGLAILREDAIDAFGLLLASLQIGVIGGLKVGNVALRGVLNTSGGVEGLNEGGGSRAAGYSMDGTDGLGGGGSGSYSGAL